MTTDHTVRGSIPLELKKTNFFSVNKKEEKKLLKKNIWFQLDNDDNL